MNILERAKIAKNRYDKESLTIVINDAKNFFGELPESDTPGPPIQLFYGNFYATMHHNENNNVWGWIITPICRGCSEPMVLIEDEFFITRFWELYDIISKEYLCDFCFTKAGNNQSLIAP